MSELINKRSGCDSVFLQLLTTTSVGALLMSVYAAQAADADRPTVWVELGAQSEQMSGMGEPFAPPFAPEIVADGFTSLAKAQQALSQSFGGEGKISFQPENSDWIFSASVLYGRADGHKATHEQANASLRIVLGSFTHYVSPSAFESEFKREKFSETVADNGASHAILDFQAGRDVGVGLFGGGSTSTINFGLRFAQFYSKRSVNIHADPDFNVPSKLFSYPKYHHTYSVMSHIDRSFSGLGPTISLNATVPLIATSNDSSINVDWGVNAAALFGRQKVRGHGQTTGAFYKTKVFSHYFNSPIHRSGNPDRTRAAVVPNLGAFAGLSFQFADAKVSVGYRGDFFFHAMDGGIDTRKSENVGFYGPFTTVNVGFGG
jgi:hypothetical protein